MTVFLAHQMIQLVFIPKMKINWLLKVVGHWYIERIMLLLVQNGIIIVCDEQIAIECLGRFIEI